MSYTKTTWVNNTTPINETNLNKIEQGIYDNSLVVDAVTNTLNPTDTETYKTAELTEGQITDVIGVGDIVIKGDTEQDGTPTPSAPVNVNVVSGSNIVYTSNNNLFNPSNIIANTNIDANGNLFNASNNNLYYISVISGEKYTMTRGQSRQWVYAFSKTVPKTGQQIGTRVVKTSTIETFTVPDGYNYIVVRQIETGSESINNLMILKGTYTTAPGYEQHQGKELPLDLGSIELCRIGDYQDYFYKESNKWYLHKEIGKVVLNGSESDWTRESYSEQYYYRLLTNIPNQSNGFSNYFTVIAYSAGLLSHTNSLRINNSYLDIVTDKSNTSLDDFKTWLSTHNTIVYYELATPTDTEITDTTLISQLEAIYNAPLYEQTNITQTNNDLPMILDITACKDNINGIKAFIRK